MSEEFNRNAQHFYKTGGCGCNYSLLDNSGVTLFSAVITPDAVGDLRDRVVSAIRKLDTLLRKERLEGSVIAQTVFLRNIGDKQLVRELLLDYYGDHLPAVTYVPQPPCDKEAVLLFEVLAIKGETQRIRVIRRGEHCVTIDIGGISLGYFGELIPDEESVGAYSRTLSAFERMKSVMEENGFKISDLLRTWLYQGSIVLPEGKTQRYKELNRSRTDFFKGVRFLENFIPVGKSGTIYPASTGIGTDGVDVKMGALAVAMEGKSPEDGKQFATAIPLENPGQTPAFDYGKVYSPQSPKFSRAMAFLYNGCCDIFISGTASIVDSETKFVGDPAAQTRQTVENIRALISEKNLKRHGIEGFHAGLENLAAVRVYVKRPEDYETIRTIGEEYFGTTPVIYVFADVCREDLLVEIEGVAACRPLRK